MPQYLTPADITIIGTILTVGAGIIAFLWANIRRLDADRRATDQRVDADRHAADQRVDADRRAADQRLDTALAAMTSAAAELRIALAGPVRQPGTNRDEPPR